MDKQRPAEAPPLSHSAEKTGRELEQTPLISAHEMAGIRGRPAAEVYADMGELRDHELVSPVRLGCTLERVDRYIYTDAGQERWCHPKFSWHQPGALSALIQRPAAVETLYGAAARLSEPFGMTRSFQWLDGMPFDALAELEEGWFLLRWLGVLRSEAALTRDIMDLGPHLSDRRTGLDQPRPSGLVFVVIDGWQREAVLRVAARLGIGDWVGVYCMEDGKWREIETARTAGMIHQPTHYRSSLLRTFEGHLRASMWVEPGSQDLFRVLNAVLQWPGITIGLLQAILGEGASGRRAQRAVTNLLNRGLIERNERVRPMPIRVTEEGMKAAAAWDRTVSEKGWTRAQMDRRLQEGFQGHEAGLLNLLSPFIEARFPTAAGWRYWEPMGRHGGIAPDALTHLPAGFFGPGWCFVEYERRASNEVDVKAKLRGYASPIRSNGWPLVLVCRDDDLEDLFHKIGKGDEERPRIPMLTTTMERLAKHGPLGNAECWSNYGEKVCLA